MLSGAPEVMATSPSPGRREELLEDDKAGMGAGPSGSRPLVLIEASISSLTTFRMVVSKTSTDASGPKPEGLREGGCGGIVSVV